MKNIILPPFVFRTNLPVSWFWFLRCHSSPFFLRLSCTGPSWVTFVLSPWSRDDTCPYYRQHVPGVGRGVRGADQLPALRHGQAKAAPELAHLRRHLHLHPLRCGRVATCGEPRAVWRGGCQPHSGDKFGKGKMKYVNWQLWKSEIVFIQSVGIAIMYSILCFNWLDIFIDKLTTIKKRILKSKHEWATNSLRLLVVHIPLKANYHTVSIMIFAILYGTQRIWIHFHKYKIIVYVNILYTYSLFLFLIVTRI